MVTRKSTTAQRPASKTAAKKTPVIRSEAKAAPAVKPAPAAPPPVNEALVEKVELVRDSFTMPKLEYDVLATLKARLIKLQRPTKKGELLRAGVAALAAMSDADLHVAVARVPNLKIGRPKKHKSTDLKSPKKKS